MMRKRIVAAAAMGVMCFWAGPSAADDHLKVSREGIELVRQLEEVGRDVRYHTERLNQFTTNTSVSRWTHYHHLEEIKRLVNTGLRPALLRLAEIQSALPEWKQKSVDDMIDSAKTLAADTTSAFMAKAENPNVAPALNEEYRELVELMHTHAESLVAKSEFAAQFAAAYLKVLEAGISPSS